MRKLCAILRLFVAVVAICLSSVSQAELSPTEEFKQALAEGKLRFDPDGTIAYDFEKGIPDRYTYTLAARLAKHTGFEDHMASNDLTTPKGLITAKIRTLKKLWLDPYYAQFDQMHFTEPYESLLVPKTHRYEIIPDGNHINGRHYSESIGQSIRFNRPNRLWIMGASWMGPYLYNDPRQEKRNEIFSENSKGPLEHLYPGIRTIRKMSWPRSANRTPDFTRYHWSEIFRTNEKGHHLQRLSVEILANAAPGQPPIGGFFVDMGGDLVPAKKMLGKPIENACIGCHYKIDKNGQHVMTFLPFQMTSPESWQKVGIHDPWLSQALMSDGKELCEVLLAKANRVL